MPRRRPGKTRTLSISVDAATGQVLKEEARAHFDGDVSKLRLAATKRTTRDALVDS